jgi:hypothetical protein
MMPKYTRNKPLGIQGSDDGQNWFWLTKQPTQQDELRRLEAENRTQAEDYKGLCQAYDQEKAKSRELLEALKRLYFAAPTSLECSAFHHSKKEQHGYGDECGPAKEYLAALSDSLAAIKKHGGGA